VLAVEDEAPGRGDVEPRVVVASGEVERHGDAADGVDQRLEGAEVDLDVVVDPHAEVLVERVDQPLRVVATVRRVDPRPAAVGDVDVEIAGERQQRDAVRLRVDAQHHDRVAALTHSLAVTEGAGVGRVGIDARAVVGSGDEEVARFRVRLRECRDRGGRQGVLALVHGRRRGGGIGALDRSGRGRRRPLVR
jgi:hypothetical protein